MARQLRDRYAQMADVVVDLDRVAEGKRPLGPTGRGTDRRSWSPWLLVACMLAMVGLGAWTWLWTTSGTRNPPLASVVQFVEVDIEHTRPNDKQLDVTLGTVNKEPNRPILENDSVRIRSRLNNPAYVYVIALRADGEFQLYYPERDDTPPPITSSILAPADEGGQVYRFPLNDGIGLQAVVLLASDRPLPPYRDWIKTVRPSLPWQRSGPDVEGVWFSDGVLSRRLDTPPPTRGKARPSRSSEPTAFAQTCKVLARRPEVKTIQAWAFPVLPADGRDRPANDVNYE
jgi:hypothetical protein